jgi:hypothetical protein
VKRWMTALVLTGATLVATTAWEPSSAEAHGGCLVCLQHLPGGRCIKARQCTAAEVKGKNIRNTPAGKQSVGKIVQVQKGKLRRTARNPRYAQPGTLPPSGSKSILKTPAGKR